MTSKFQNALKEMTKEQRARFLETEKMPVTQRGSRSIIAYLMEQGFSRDQICKKIKTKSLRKNLTMGQVRVLADCLEIPMPVLLFKAMGSCENDSCGREINRLFREVFLEYLGKKK